MGRANALRLESGMSVLVEEDNAQIVKQAREEGVFEIHQALRMAINRAQMATATKWRRARGGGRGRSDGRL